MNSFFTPPKNVLASPVNKPFTISIIPVNAVLTVSTALSNIGPISSVNALKNALTPSTIGATFSAISLPYFCINLAMPNRPNINPPLINIPFRPPAPIRPPILSFAFCAKLLSSPPSSISTGATSSPPPT